MQARPRPRPRFRSAILGPRIRPGNGLGKASPGLGGGRPVQVLVGALRHASFPGLAWISLLRRLLANFRPFKVAGQLSWRYYVPFLEF